MNAVSDVLCGRNASHHAGEGAEREPMMAVAKQLMAAAGPTRQPMLSGEPVSAEPPRGWVATCWAVARKAAAAASSQRRELAQRVVDQRADPTVAVSAVPPAHAVW